MSQTFRYDPDEPDVSFIRKSKHNTTRRRRQEINRYEEFMTSVISSQDGESPDDYDSSGSYEPPAYKGLDGSRWVR